ncbi:MAG: phosphoenolpyruvate carboxykinase (ATP), partial [Pseudomonadota bacterium]
MFNPSAPLEAIGAEGLKKVYYNLRNEGLMQEAVARGEGEIGIGGTFLTTTGKHTGRSPKDKFVVDEPSVKDKIWWENNPPMAVDAFERLKADMLAHMSGREYFVQDLYGGADPDYRLNVRVVTELAWHGLFIRHLLRRPELEELEEFTPEFTVVNCPSFLADPAKHGCRTETVIAISFEQKLILIGGT